jgi:phage/plasmid-like protein (TIGR03299 family)
MSHGIQEQDKGAVGFVEKFGRTWHGIESYVQFDGKVPMETAERIADYNVTKVPSCLPQEYGGGIIEGSNTLIRTDTNTVLFPSVGRVYEVIQNSEILKYIEEDILDVYKNISIESCGTLFNGRRFFINLLIKSYKVNGDVSETKTRLMLTNSFGGDALTSNLHDTRVVCNNTVTNAIAQGKVNGTLKKFRHTMSAPDRLKDHTLNLADIFDEQEIQVDRFNHLASQKVMPNQVKAYLEEMFPTEGKKKRGLTIAQNTQDAIMNLYESKDDLVALDHTKYRFLNAVTDWADHEKTVKNGDDEGKRFWSNIQGDSNDLKQQAFQMLLA